MSKPDDIAELLSMYAARADSPRIPFPSFLQFCRKVAERRSAQEERFLDLGGPQVEPILIAHLRALKQRELLSMTFSAGSPTEIFFPEYYYRRLRDYYDYLDERPALPFPHDDNIDFTILSEHIQPVTVTEEFTRWIRQSEDSPKRILRLQFPDTLSSVLVLSEMIEERLLMLCMQKIRLHLRSEKNAGYMQHKLLGHFPNREIALRDSLNQLLTTPREAAAMVMHPSDFTYHFWTQVCNNIIKDLRSGNHESSETELGLGQAAYLVGYYNTHFRGADQRKRETEAAEKYLLKTLDRVQDPFTYADLASMPDDKGNPLSKRISKERITGFIEDRLKPAGDSDLPEILLVRASDGREIYLARKHALTYFLRTRTELSTAMQEAYSQAWYNAYRTDRITSSMKSDDAFDRHIYKEVCRRDTVFAGMLKYDLLRLLSERAPPDQAHAAEVNFLFHPGESELRPLHEIFELERKKILKDAELRLPFYLATPTFRAIMRFLRRVFSSAPKRPRVVDDVSDAPESAEIRSATTTTDRPARGERAGRVVESEVSSESGKTTGNAPSTKRADRDPSAYRRKVAEISQDFLPAGKSIDTALKELAEQWNPLLDAAAKQNLVEDINSLVRDFLRKMRSGFRSAPPGPDRIRRMAEELAAKDSFSKIRRKEALQRYIELYMLKLLGKL